MNRVSYNGGQGGLRARPSGHELAAAHDRHVDFTPAQREHEHTAFGNHDLRASVNGGKPRIAATERPGEFSGRGVVQARAAGAPYTGDRRGRPRCVEALLLGTGPRRVATGRVVTRRLARAAAPFHAVARRSGSARSGGSRRPAPGAGGSAAIRGGAGGGPTRARLQGPPVAAQRWRSSGARTPGTQRSARGCRGRLLARAAELNPMLVGPAPRSARSRRLAATGPQCRW